MPYQDFIQQLKKGDPITADWLNEVARAAGIEFSVPNGIATREGVWIGEKLGIRLRLGKTDSSVLKGFSVTVSQYKGDGDGGTESDTGYNFTAFSRFSDIETAKWVFCVRFLSHWEIIVWEC